MIGKQIKGRGFSGLLRYLQEKEKAELIGGNMSGRNAKELSAEFQVSRQLNPELERAVYHVSLSLPLHERLDNERWNEIAEKYMQGMGFDANQYAVFRHHDQDHDHIHIAASRIRLDTGLAVHDSWDYVRSEKLIRGLERDYGLEQVQSSREKLERTSSTGQHRRQERQQQEYELGDRTEAPEVPVKEQLQNLIKIAAQGETTLPQLISQLHESGIEVRAGLTRTGKNKGISYECEGQHFSGSQLGAAFTFSGLQKHLGVDYDPVRDDARVQDLIDRRLVRDGQIEDLLAAVSDCMNTTKRHTLELGDYWAQWDKDQQTLVIAEYDQNDQGDRSVFEAKNEGNEWVLLFDGTYQKDVDVLMHELKQPQQQSRRQVQQQERQVKAVEIER